MNDAVFNTLLAVLQMCNTHFAQASGGLVGQLHVDRWAHGFEQCATIQQSVEDETARRAKAQKAEDDSHDLARLRNGLNAVQGKPFAPEAKPPPQKLPWGMGGCMQIQPVSGSAQFVTPQ